MSQRLRGTITVRLSARSLRLLKARAKQSRRSASEVLRDLVEKQLEPWPKGISAWDLTQQWVGSVNSTELPHGARVREALAEWNPDRR